MLIKAKQGLQCTFLLTPNQTPRDFKGVFLQIFTQHFDSASTLSGYSFFVDKFAGFLAAIIAH
jgi:hypothetical protein